MNDSTHFLQFLEGPSAATSDTILRIMADKRHDDLRILICEPTQTRFFSNWHMKHAPIDMQRHAISEKVETIQHAPQAERGLLLQGWALDLLTSSQDAQRF